MAVEITPFITIVRGTLHNPKNCKTLTTKDPSFELRNFGRKIRKKNNFSGVSFRRK